MNIFYNLEGLQDTLIICIKNIEHDTIDVNNGFIVLKNQNEIIGLNIFNFSKYLKIASGYIYPTNEIISIVGKITKINIQQFKKINFQVGLLLSSEKIINTKLSKCNIDIKNEVLQIICGANNFSINDLVVVAKIGSMLPNGFGINKNKIQNFDSYGMLCSQKELNITSSIVESKGILILNNKKYNLGQEFIDLYNNTI